MARTTQLVDLLLPRQAEALAAIAMDTAAEPHLRSHIFAAFGRAQPVYSTLVDVSHHDDDPRIALRLLRGLEPASPGSEFFLRRLLASPFPEVRREAAERAGELGRKALLPLLLDLLQDANPAVSAAAARSAWSLSPPPRPYLSQAPAALAEGQRLESGAAIQARAS